MKQSNMRYIAGLCAIFAGMFGLWLHIEYSGWVLFFGLMVIA